MSKEVIVELVDKLRREMMLRKPALGSKVRVLFRKDAMTHDIIMDCDGQGEARFRALERRTESLEAVRNLMYPGNHLGLSTKDYAVYIFTEWNC